MLGGRQAVTILTKLTWWCGGIFLLLSLVLSLVPRGGSSSALQERLRAATPAAPQQAPLPLGAPTQPATSTRHRPLRPRPLPPVKTPAPCQTQAAAAPSAEETVRPAPRFRVARGRQLVCRDQRTTSSMPAFGEVVFTTNLTGYQETFTDPSYLGQIVVMTAPMIGNYGVNAEDSESDHPQVSGVVVRELSRHSSNWRSTQSLDEWLACGRGTQSSKGSTPAG